MKGYTFLLILIGINMLRPLCAQSLAGVVCDSATNRPLEWAVVTLLDEGGRPLQSGITDSTGAFTVPLRPDVCSLLFHLLGYTERRLAPEELAPADTVRLAARSEWLPEVDVVQDKTVRSFNKDTYFIDDSLRKNAVNAAQVLAKLPGITYNWLDKSVWVYGKQDVLFLVNGVEKPLKYIKNINPKRIAKVEVAYNPEGRFLSGTHTAIVNLIQKEDYLGWDLSVSNDTHLLLNKLKSGRVWMEESPELDFTYTRGRLTVNASYLYDRQRLQYTLDREETYADVLHNTTSYADAPAPWQRENWDEHTLQAGFDYQLAEKHTLSLQTQYSNDVDHNRYQHRMASTHDGATHTSEQRIGNKDVENNLAATLFYQGAPSTRLTLYGDFNYNYYVNNGDRSYAMTDWFSALSRWHSVKQYTRLNLETVYTPAAQVSLRAGYIFTWKDYLTTDRETRLTEAAQSHFRHRLFAYCTYKPNDTWSASLGGALEWIRSRSEGGASDRYAVFLPDARLTWRPSESCDFIFRYQTLAGYPVLEQTAIGDYREDSLMIFRSNPWLQTCATHALSLQVRVADRLSVKPFYHYAKNSIARYYEALADAVVSDTYVNADLKTWGVEVDFTQPLGASWECSFTGSYERPSIRYKAIKNRFHLFRGQASLTYMHPRFQWAAQLLYNRWKGKEIRLQGYEEKGNDFIGAGVMKSFCQDRLGITLMYLLPLRWGLRPDCREVVEAGRYRYLATQHTFELTKNFLSLSLTYRFEAGRKTRAKGHRVTLEKEKIN